MLDHRSSLDEWIPYKGMDYMSAMVFHLFLLSYPNVSLLAIHKISYPYPTLSLLRSSIFTLKAMISLAMEVAKTKMVLSR